MNESNDKRRVIFPIDGKENVSDVLKVAKDCFYDEGALSFV
jgi:hypothetical protein